MGSARLRSTDQLHGAAVSREEICCHSVVGSADRIGRAAAGIGHRERTVRGSEAGIRRYRIRGRRTAAVRWAYVPCGWIAHHGRHHDECDRQHRDAGTPHHQSGRAGTRGGPLQCADRHTATRTEGHIPDGVIALRALPRFVGAGAAARSVQQGDLQTDSQRQQDQHRDDQMHCQHEYLRDGCDIGQAESHKTDGDSGDRQCRCWANMRGPQHHPDESSGSRGRQRHRHRLNAGLDQQSAQGPVVIHQPVVELGRQPAQCGCRTEGEGPDGADHKAIQRFSCARPEQADRHHRCEHQHHGAERNTEAVPHDPELRHVDTHRHVILARHGGSGQQRPTRTQSRTQDTGQQQHPRWKVLKGSGFTEITDEQQWQAERGQRGDRCGHPQQCAGEHRDRQRCYSQTVGRAGPVRKCREQ